MCLKLEQKKVKKNLFAALESDEEKEEVKTTPNEYVRKKFNWADDSDDE